MNVEYSDDNSTEVSSSESNFFKGKINAEKFSTLIIQFLKNFIKWYGVRVILGLLKKFMKMKSKIFTLPFDRIFKIFFNIKNVRTGLFISLLPTLFKIFNLLFTKINLFDEKFITFISGFISSLIAILFAEKANIMNFVILSVFVRSLHSLLVVYLKNKGYPVHNKIISWIVLSLACFGALYLYFYHTSFVPMTNLIEKFAQFQGNERKEIYNFRDAVKIF
jgi:hypothetical protein